MANVRTHQRMLTIRSRLIFLSIASVLWLSGGLRAQPSVIESSQFNASIAELPPRPQLPQLDSAQHATDRAENQPAQVQAIAPTQVKVALPVAYPAVAGQLLVQPQVQLNAIELPAVSPLDPNWLMSHRPSVEYAYAGQMESNLEMLPSPQPFSPRPSIHPLETMEATPVFQSLLEEAPATPLVARRSTQCGSGLGHERLAFSLFDIDTAQPFNNFRIRSVLANRMHLPDRAEYFWAKTRTGTGPPLGESRIDYQEARIRMELGSKKLSTAFELPFRSTNPEINQNHAGPGDMQLIVKTVLIDGKQWMLTQYFGTRFPTGNPNAGLGTGKVSLEPGLLFRNQFRDNTWMHGELKFWFPLGADPQHGGQVLKFATGVNHVWRETDTNAWIPSLEISAYSVLNGMATDAFGTVRSIDHDAIFYLTPGLHYAVDPRGDFGLFEIGSAVSIATSTQRFADATWIFDMRWSW